jgi:hypothetical protein
VEDWRKPLIDYLHNPSSSVDRKVRRWALKFVLDNGELYRRTVYDLLLKCLDPDQARLAMAEVHVGVLDRQTYQGVPEVVDCAVRIVIGRPRTRRSAQGHGTQDLYRFGLPRWRALRPIWGSSMAPRAWCWVEIRWDWGCAARYPALLYIVQGAGS